MRIKDDEKIERIYRAAIHVVNSDGLQGTSMSKIAKEADVSAATIYLYFENKDDMIQKLFLNLKNKMGHSYFSGINELQPSKGTFRMLWLNYYQYITEQSDEYQFLQNFSNCPLILTVKKEDTADYCPAFEKLFNDSKQAGLLTELNNDMLYSLLFAPLNHLIKRTKTTGISLSTTELMEVFEASWRGIEKKGIKSNA